MLQWILPPSYPFSLVFLEDRAYRVLFPMLEQPGFLCRGRWAGRAGELTPPFLLILFAQQPRGFGQNLSKPLTFNKNICTIKNGEVQQGSSLLEKIPQNPPMLWSSTLEKNLG